MVATMRNRVIVLLASLGMRKPTIARLFGITRARVYQILVVSHNNDLRRREKQG